MNNCPRKNPTYNKNTHTTWLLGSKPHAMKQHKEFLYPLVYIFSCGTYILRRVVISVVLEEISVHLEEFINHPLGDRRHDRIMSINIYPPLRHLQKKSFKNLIKIQL
jgi:hypothetical protein